MQTVMLSCKSVAACKYRILSKTFARRRTHEVVETVETGELGHDDERRGASAAAAAEKGRVVVRDVQADDQQGGEVDQTDTPECAPVKRKSRIVSGAVPRR